MLSRHASESLSVLHQGQSGRLHSVQESSDVYVRARALSGHPKGCAPELWTHKPLQSCPYARSDLLSHRALSPRGQHGRTDAALWHSIDKLNRWLLNARRTRSSGWSEVTARATECAPVGLRVLVGMKCELWLRRQRVSRRVSRRRCRTCPKMQETVSFEPIAYRVAITESFAGPMQEGLTGAGSIWCSRF